MPLFCGLPLHPWATAGWLGVGRLTQAGSSESTSCSVEVEPGDCHWSWCRVWSCEAREAWHGHFCCRHREAEKPGLLPRNKSTGGKRWMETCFLDTRKGIEFWSQVTGLTGPLLLALQGG